MFYLGVICGLLIVMAVLLLDIYLWLKKASFTDRIIKEVAKLEVKPVEIIQPPTPAQEALLDFIDQNEQEGLDTKLEDFLK